MDAESVKPLLNRPRVLRQRSQSAVTPTDAVDSDTSKRSSLKHRQTHSHHHIPHHPKRFAKDILGLQNEHSLADLSKQTSRISESSKDVAAQQQVNESRKASTVGYNPDGAAQSSLDGDEVERMVWKEQWKNKARQSELRSTLHALSEESMKTTRRLDDLYYDLLEKVSGLRSTINNLQELSGFTAQLHGQFKTETSRLTSDLQKQINGFKGFKTQQSKIDALDLRVKESKKKADGLSARLEAARERVSALEIREQEWQDSVSWRLRLVWIIAGIVAGIVLMVCLMQLLGYGPKHASHAYHQDEARSNLASLTSVPASVKSLLEEVIGTPLNITATHARTNPAIESRILGSRTSRPPELEPTSPADQDTWQKIFDEL